MHDGAADAVAPSPRAWGGERVGVRGTPVEWASAPHPSPLPVKNGEREQPEFAARLEPNTPRCAPTRVIRCVLDPLAASPLADAVGLLSPLSRSRCCP